MAHSRHQSPIQSGPCSHAVRAADNVRCTLFRLSSFQKRLCEEQLQLRPRIVKTKQRHSNLSELIKDSIVWGVDVSGHRHDSLCKSSIKPTVD